MTELRLLILEPASFMMETTLYSGTKTWYDGTRTLYEEPIHWFPATMNLMLVWQVPRLVLPS